jgi:hypothetical protein
MKLSWLRETDFGSLIESPLLALSGQSDRARVCPLLNQSGQSRVLARCGLSAFDPKRTCRHLCRGATVVIKKVLSKLVQLQQIGPTHYQFLSFILSLR